MDNENIELIKEITKRMEAGIQLVSNDVKHVADIVGRVEKTAERAADTSQKNNTHLIRLNGAVARNVIDIGKLQQGHESGSGKSEKKKTSFLDSKFWDFASKALDKWWGKAAAAGIGTLILATLGWMLKIADGFIQYLAAQ